MSSSSSSYHLRASPTFVWSTGNILGKGATGAVFQGVHKMTGEAVAVKTFNKLSEMRPHDVQVREFEVLKKVKHENIVKLLAIEQELETHSKVLVMELCTGGSLFTILDDPENTYGVKEEEFLLVLKHLTDGMNHLRDNNIVHRDLKPGNIMKYITEDGRSIYKLTDFGAARELDDDQQFVSLYGTEEYLHPDMYERAVLRKPPLKSFGATVDLWSIGITLYHVATGSLPFRPYGGRKNRETMHYITTKKESGVISGVQSCENGPIDWGRELPSTCQLSAGLCKFVTPLLAGLMEGDPARVWSFDHFFTEVSNLVRRQPLHLFHVERCHLLRLYVHPSDNLEELSCFVFEQTDVCPDKQTLYFDHKSLGGTAEKRSFDFPRTSSEEPIFLLGKTSESSVVTLKDDPPFPKFPTFSTSISTDQDSTVSKSHAGIAHCIKRSVESLALRHRLLKSAALTLNAVTVAKFTRLKFEADRVEERSAATTHKTKMLQSRHRTTSSILELTETVTEEITEERNKLQLLVNSKQESNSTVSKQMLTILNRISSGHKRIVEEQQLWSQWKETPIYEHDLSKCPARASTYVQTMKSCWQALLQHRSLRTLSYNDEQFHILEKVKSQETRQKLLKLFQDDCLAVMRDSVHHFGQFLNSSQRAHTHAVCLQSDLDKFAEMLKVHDTTLDEANETYDEMTQGLISILRLSQHKGVQQPMSDRGINKEASDASSAANLEAKKIAIQKYFVEGLRDISHSHTELMELLAENHSLLDKLHLTSLDLSKSVNNLQITDDLNEDILEFKE